MKIKVLILLLLLGYFSQEIFASNPTKYRVQCAISSEKMPAQKIQQIPDLKLYILPSGTKLYFSGSFYVELIKADSILKIVKGLGYKTACIRVFKGEVLLSRIEGVNFIKSLKEKNHPKQEVALQTPTKKEVPIIKKITTDSALLEAKKEVKLSVNEPDQNVIVLSELPQPPDRKNGEGALVNSSMVPDPPIFRIYLANVPADSLSPDFISELSSEKVFMFNQNNQKYYLVGRYANEEAAFEALKKYKSISASADVVAQYRRRIISLELANQLYQRYHNFPHRY